MNSGKIVWCDTYYECRVYCDSEGIKPIRQPFWSYYYSKQEYLLATLRGTADEPIRQNIQQEKQERKKRFYDRLNSRRDRPFGVRPKSTGSKTGS
jgi:hypothetical protein